MKSKKVVAETMVSLSAFTAGAMPRIEISQLSANTDGTVDIILDIADNPGVIALCVNVEYDPSCVSLTGTENCELFEGASFTESGSIDTVPYRLIWDSALSKSNYENNGKIAVLHFKMLESAEGDITEIRVGVDNGNTFDVDLRDVHFEGTAVGVELPKRSENEDKETKEDREDQKKETNTAKDRFETSAVGETAADTSKLCASALEDYTGKYGGNNVGDIKAVPVIKADGTMSVMIKDADGNVLETYSSDLNFGMLTASDGRKVSLTSADSAKSNRPDTIIIAVIAAAVLCAAIIILFNVNKRRKSDRRS